MFSLEVAMVVLGCGEASPSMSAEGAVPRKRGDFLGTYWAGTQER